MQIEPNAIEPVLHALAASPQRLETLSTGIDKTRLHHRSDDEPWSANDILAHLRACADVWGESIQIMLKQDHPTLRYVSPRTWMKKTDYPQQDFRVSFTAFTHQRNELLETLAALKQEDWLRGATFTATIRGKEHTVLSYAQRMARHEDEHCVQLEALLR